MSAPDVLATSSPVSQEFDILDEVTIEMPCQRCGGTYGGTARQILLAHDVLPCGGCQGKDDRECLPLAYADLVDLDRSANWTRPGVGLSDTLSSTAAPYTSWRGAGTDVHGKEPTIRQEN